MKRFAFALAATLLASPWAIADSAPATGLVETASGDAVKFLEDGQLSATEAEALLATIDVDGIARFALGKHVRAVSESELSEYNAVFRDFLKAQLQQHLSGFEGADIKVVDTIERNARDVIVRTRVSAAGEEPIVVSWRVRERRGEWGVVDVESMGIWLAIEQRAQFAAVLDQNGGKISHLIADLKRKG